MQGVAYSATFKACSDLRNSCEYVGETSRNLAARIKEHCRRTSDNRGEEVQSAIGQHSIQVHGVQPCFDNWVFKILEFSNRTQDRKTLEALHIHRNKPTLNRDRGVGLFLANVKL